MPSISYIQSSPTTAIDHTDILKLPGEMGGCLGQPTSQALNGLIRQSACCPAAGGQPPMTEAGAVKGLNDNLSSIADPQSGMIDANALMNAAQGNFQTPPATPEKAREATAAAKYFLDHPGKFKALETADGVRAGDAAASTPDGKISAGDLTSRASALAGADNCAADNCAQPPMTERGAIQAFIDHPLPSGVNLSQDNLKQIASGSGLSQDNLKQISSGSGPLKQAAQYYLDNPSAFNAMQSASQRSHGNMDTDGKFGNNDMIARLQEMDKGGDPAGTAGGQPPMTERSAIQAFMDHPLDSSENLSADDLKKIASGSSHLHGENLSEDDLKKIASGSGPLKQAAQYFLDKTSAFNGNRSASQPGHVGTAGGIPGISTSTGPGNSTTPYSNGVTQTATALGNGTTSYSNIPAEGHVGTVEGIQQAETPDPA